MQKLVEGTTQCKNHGMLHEGDNNLKDEDLLSIYLVQGSDACDIDSLVSEVRIFNQSCWWCDLCSEWERDYNEKSDAGSNHM